MGKGGGDLRCIGVFRIWGLWLFRRGRAPGGVGGEGGVDGIRNHHQLPPPPPNRLATSTSSPPSKQPTCIPNPPQHPTWRQTSPLRNSIGTSLRAVNLARQLIDAYDDRKLRVS